MLKEYDRVKTKVGKKGFQSGSVGVIVSVYSSGEACEVEIWDEDECPIDVVTYRFEQLEKIE